MWHFLFFIVDSISDKCVFDDGSSNTTRLQIIMPNACQEFALWMEEGGMEE